MAKSLNGATKVNPRFFKGDVPEAIDVLPSNAATYICGELAVQDSSGTLAAIADDPSAVTHVMAAARSAAKTATADKAFKIDTDTMFSIQVVDGTTDTAASQTMVGQNYSLEVISNVACLDLDSGTAHSNDIFHVDGLMSDIEPSRHAIADVPGCVYGHFLRTASNDVNAA